MTLFCLSTRTRKHVVTKIQILTEDESEMKTILKDEAPRDFHIEISQVPESHLIPQASITMSSPLSLHIRVPSPMSAETTDSESDFADDQNSVQVQSFTGLNCSISPNNPFQSYGKCI